MAKAGTKLRLGGGNSGLSGRLLPGWSGWSSVPEPYLQYQQQAGQLIHDMQILVKNPAVRQMM